MINNYSHIGFLPGNSLQSSELNELQERFYLDQTLQNNFLFNWLIFTENNFTITGLQSDTYNGPYSGNIIPLNPNLIETFYSLNNITIRLNSGWYKINHNITSNMAVWVYLDGVKEISVPMSISGGLYYVGMNIELSEILCTSTEEDEGYFFNSNVGGYIEPWIPGSNRFKILIGDLKLIFPNEQTSQDLTILKIRTGTGEIASGRFLIQYINNYKINDIIT